MIPCARPELDRDRRTPRVRAQKAAPGLGSNLAYYLSIAIGGSETTARGSGRGSWREPRHVDSARRPSDLRARVAALAQELKTAAHALYDTFIKKTPALVPHPNIEPSSNR
jgi:hypothetical protein